MSAPTTKLVEVFGTKGWTKDPRRSWWPNDSPFNAFMRRQGFELARPYRPFYWTGGLDGVPVFANGNDWEAGRENFIDYCEALPYEWRNVIGHSHGGQIILGAAAAGLQLRSVILIGTPVRKEVEEKIAPEAVKNIGRCLHLVDARFDKMGLLGAVLDRRISFRRTFDVDGIDSRKVKGIGHSGLLYEPKLFEKWLEHDWLDVLRGAPAPAVPHGV